MLKYSKYMERRNKSTTPIVTFSVAFGGNMNAIVVKRAITKSKVVIINSNKQYLNF